MKKLPLFLVGLIPAFLTINVNATVLNDGIEWWTPQELATHFIEKNTKREAICGDDSICHNAVLDELMEKDILYRTGFNLFTETRFIISSINRGNNTIEVFFNNDDINISKYNPGWRDTDIRTLFIGWFDENPNQIYELTDNNLFLPDENRHALYSETHETMGVGWLPSQEFLSIQLNGNLNETDYIAYYARSGIFYTKKILDISNCANNPNWGSCDLLISKDGEMRYFGANGELIDDPVVPPNDGGEPTDEPIEQPSIKPEPEPVDEEPVINPIESETPSERKETISYSTEKPVIITTDSAQEYTMMPEKTDEKTIKEPVAEVIDIPLVGNTTSMNPTKCNKVDFPRPLMPVRTLIALRLSKVVL